MKKFSKIAIVSTFAISLLGANVGDAFAAKKKIYLVNGFFSAALGYGLKNLSKKISGERYFEFVGGVPASTKRGIIADAARAYKRDPNTRIGLVGISAGANAVTQIAAALGKQGVPVHYLAAIEGGKMTPVGNNVVAADSFVCTGGTCKSISMPRKGGNAKTRFSTIRLNTSHIGSSDSPKLHRRVISKLNSM